MSSSPSISQSLPTGPHGWHIQPSDKRLSWAALLSGALPCITQPFWTCQTFFFLTHVASWSPGSALLSVLTRLGSVLVLSTLDAHRCLCCALDLLDNKPSLPPKPRSSHVPL